MSISFANSRVFGVRPLRDKPERFVVYAPDGQRVCEFTLTLREHPQIIGAWLVNIESRPGDSARLNIKVENENLFWVEEK
jgi:hypothetical protein